MTVDGRDREQDAGVGAFDGIDPKLTIYALANGMDLDKNGDFRRLAWYRDGLDRGILLRADANGTISLTAQAWKRGDDASLRHAPIAEGVPPTELVGTLTSLLERGLEAANAL